MKILFIHPDLGIGGAERLIVDCALTCKNLGHQVYIITNHHDKNHCFEETLNELSVQVVGGWFPRKIFGKFHAFCTYLRMIIISIYLIFASKKGHLKDLDAIILDSVSAPILLIKSLSRLYTFKPNFKIIFYCHFPDFLLTQSNTFVKKVYRYFIDWIEEKSTGLADVILVNSKFTEGVFRKSFPSLKNKKTNVLYPVCAFKALDQHKFDKIEEFNNLVQDDLKFKKNFVFLSINRFERKKNINLAVNAFKNLTLNNVKNVRLILAGGYDERVQENIEYFNELQEICNDLNLTDQVILLKSPNDYIKTFLYEYCDCVIYTPENEHFGIVPIEAMYKKKIVIACNSGGPLETIVNFKTGFLCEPNANAFSKVMFQIINNKDSLNKLGQNCYKHVIGNFSYENFKKKLEIILNQLNEN